jgi:hypothetical protein
VEVGHIMGQKKNMEQNNSRFEHVVYILKKELLQEHAREEKLLQITTNENNKNEKKIKYTEVWLERLKSVDLIIKMLKSYKLLSGFLILPLFIFLLFSFLVFKTATTLISCLVIKVSRTVIN